MNVKKILLLGLSLLSLIPSFASAHVKWFAEPIGTGRPYQITDTPVLIWIGIVIAVVIAGMFLEKKIKVPVKVAEKAVAWRDYAVSIAHVGFGLSLVLFSLNGFIFAPNFPVDCSFSASLNILQALIGVMLIFGLYPRVSALMLATLFGMAVYKYGALEMLDAVEFLGIAIFVFLTGRPALNFKWLSTKEKGLEVPQNWLEYSVPILRVFTGVNLMILAFSEKIFATSLTASFLSHYSWNFMSGFGMSDYWFAFSAGMAEFLIGLILALGLVTRITTLALAGFLVTTLIALGPIELVGHLPHFSIAIVLLLIGAGTKLKLAK